MSYEKFITDFLNIKPSDLSKISTSTGSDGSVFIRIRLSKKSVLCPYCNGNAKVKAYYDRKLTHSTFSNRICYIIYEQRRYLCKSCSCSFNENNLFSTSRKKLTYEPKINILKDLKYSEATYTSVARRYNTSTNKVLRIFDKHVDIPRKKLPTILSMDEHYFPSSDHSAKYCCLWTLKLVKL